MTLKYTDEYARKFTFAEEAVKVVKSGDRVIYAFGICSINELDRALAMRKDELLGVDIICNDLSCGYYTMDADFSEEHFRFYEGMYQGKRKEKKFMKEEQKGEAILNSKVRRKRIVLTISLWLPSVPWIKMDTFGLTVGYLRSTISGRTMKKLIMSFWKLMSVFWKAEIKIKSVFIYHRWI